MQELQSKDDQEINWKRLGAFAVGFALLLLVYRYFTDTITAKSSTKKIYESAWSEHTLGIDSSILISSPVDFAHKVIDPSSTGFPSLIAAESYQYQSYGNIEIMLNLMLYQDNEAPTLEGAADGSLHEVEHIQGIQQLEYIEDKLTKNSVEGIHQHGTFVLQAVKYHFSNIIFMADHKMWQLSLTYASEDDYAKQIADRMVNSFTVKP